LRLDCAGGDGKIEATSRAPVLVISHPVNIDAVRPPTPFEILKKTVCPAFTLTSVENP